MSKNLWLWSALGLLTACAPMQTGAASSKPGAPSSVGTAFFKEVSAAVVAKSRGRAQASDACRTINAGEPLRTDLVIDSAFEPARQAVEESLYDPKGYAYQYTGWNTDNYKEAVLGGSQSTYISYNRNSINYTDERVYIAVVPVQGTGSRTAVCLSLYVPSR
jgi:hypothetical protein